MIKTGNLIFVYDLVVNNGILWRSIQKIEYIYIYIYILDILTDDDD